MCPGSASKEAGVVPFHDIPGKRTAATIQPHVRIRCDANGRCDVRMTFHEIHHRDTFTQNRNPCKPKRKNDTSDALCAAFKPRHWPTTRDFARQMHTHEGTWVCVLASLLSAPLSFFFLSGTQSNRPTPATSMLNTTYGGMLLLSISSFHTTAPAQSALVVGRRRIVAIL